MISGVAQDRGSRHADQPPLRAPSSGRLVTLVLVDVSLLFTLVLLRDPLGALGLRAISVIAIAVAAYALVTAAAGTQEGFWSCSSLYLLAFLPFHFGLTFIFVTGQEVPVLYGSGTAASNTTAWTQLPQTRYALVLATIAAVAFVLGSHLVLLLRTQQAERRARPAADAVTAATAEADGTAVANWGTRYEALSTAGAVLMIATVGLWFFTLLRNDGVAILASSYGGYLAAVRGLSITTQYFLITIALALLAAGNPSRARRLGLGAFFLWALVALPIGLRGEVMFPALLAIAILAKRRRIPVRPLTAIALVVIMLGAVSGLRTIRSEGIAEISASAVEFSPTAGLSELGGSLRPVAVVMQWQESGEARMNGASFTSPFERALQNLPGGKQLAAQEDSGLLGQTVKQRVSGIGFSPVAEGYINFGVAGVIAMLLATGMIFGFFDFGQTTPRRLATLGVVLAPLLLEIRNSFAFVPGQIALGLALLVAIHWVFELLGKRSQHTASRRVGRNGGPGAYRLKGSMP